MPASARPIGALLLKEFVSAFFLSLRYFFAVPTSFLATTLILFALAWFKLPARSGQPS